MRIGRSPASLAKLCLAGLLLPAGGAAFGPSPALAEDAGPRFKVREYRVEGATLVPEGRIGDALRGYAGEQESFDTLRRAVEAVEALYQDAGFPAVRVQLPEQEIEGGVVRLRVIEARLGQVIVEGNRHYSEENIRASLPDLVAGRPPAMDRVGASLALANESFAKRTRITLAKGDTEAEVDARVQVADEKPWRLIGLADNSGTEATGRHRLGIMAQHANLFDRDHAASFTYLTSPQKPSDVNIYHLGYRIPLYEFGDSLELSFSRSDVDSGTVGGQGMPTLAIAGRGATEGVRYHLGLPRVEGHEQRFSLALDRKLFEARVVPAGGGASLVPDLSTFPLTLTYSLSSPEGQAASWKLSLASTRNLPRGDKGDTAAFNQPGARPGADARFQAWRWEASASAALADWTLKGELQGQETRDLLISGEQFGIGGANSVRGFNEREVANDRGHRGGIELTTPAWSSGDGWRANLAGFYDFGRVRRNGALPGEQVREGIASLGVGLRLAVGRNAYFKADLARVLDGGGTKLAGDLTAHMLLVLVY
ncbi:MAG: ShlB/FhaC/HecB family hemolysin secretion/activation protein [Rhodocyclaceae bacterium]|nr:ShlB/FhaC/HecB family hemolysin secretion/activation protein [Rhodocyclaceae bacterium]